MKNQHQSCFECQSIRKWYGYLGYSVPGPRPSYPALRPWYHKSFNQLNFLLGKIQSLWSCANYFQWFTGYLKHVGLLMSQAHVLKKLPYFSMCTSVVSWILSCAQLTNACSKLIIKKIRLIYMCSHLEKTTAWLSSCFYCWLWP